MCGGGEIERKTVDVENGVELSSRTGWGGVKDGGEGE